MSWTVVPLVRVVFAVAACAALEACVDPHGDYDDFKARPVAEVVVHDAAAPDVQLTECESLLQKNPSGDYYVTCWPLPAIFPTPFGLVVHQDLTVSDGGQAELTSWFKLLDIHGTNINQTVSDRVDVPPASINDNCTYDLNIGDLIVPEKATTLGGEAKAEHVKLHAFLQTEDLACAELDGQVITPIPLNLEPPGDFCVFRRVASDGTLPKIPDSDYACALPNADP
jgi:hypothetical protein